LAGGIIQILVGIVAIVLGFTADAFYPAFMRRPRPDERPMPKWVGRAIFSVVGAGFIYSGLSDWRRIQLGATTKGILWILVGLAVVAYDLTADRIYADPNTNQRARWAGRILTFIFAVGVISLGVSCLTRQH
jgi:putative Mn2+ efflux pump MntP